MPAAIRGSLQAPGPAAKARLLQLTPEALDALAPHLMPRLRIALVATRNAAPDTREAENRAMVVLSTHPVRDAAGKTIASFERHVGADAAVIRTIPNTPAAVGRGITAMAANANVSPAQLALARSLLAAVGEVVTVENEAMIDAVTAVSGSGPAYVFYLTECLAAAGEKAGLPKDLAMQLARATVSGAGELMRQSGIEAATLRQNVTSPKGTTYEALQVLMAADGMGPLFEKAVAAALRRSRELAS